MKRGWFFSLALAVVVMALLGGCSKSGGKGSEGSGTASGSAESANPSGAPSMASEHGIEGGAHGTETESGSPMGSGMPSGPPPGSSTCAASGVVWELPAGWSTEGERPMRVATYTIPAASGDSEGAECAVFHFGPNQGGGVDSNIERWIDQFKPAKSSKRSSREVNGLKVDLVQIVGTFTAPAGPMMQSTGAKENFRLLGAIVDAPQGLVFFKLTGPAKTVGAASKGFDALVASIKRG